MMRSGKNYTGNARFYGFCIDLLELIADMAGFSYIMEVVPDRTYGAQDPETGEWDGMVNEIIKGVRQAHCTSQHLMITESSCRRDTGTHCALVAATNRNALHHPPFI